MTLKTAAPSTDTRSSSPDKHQGVPHFKDIGLRALAAAAHMMGKDKPRPQPAIKNQPGPEVHAHERRSLQFSPLSD